MYLVLSVLATLGQAAFVLYLFIDPAHAEREVAKYQRTRDGTIKWVLAGGGARRPALEQCPTAPRAGDASPPCGGWSVHQAAPRLQLPLLGPCQRACAPCLAPCPQGQPA